MSNMSYSNYGVLKNIGEKYTQTLGGIVVKFWNVYGVEKDLSKSHVITDFVLKALKKKKIKMLTNGKEVRDFLYAEDCCTGLEIIMNKYNFLKKQKKSIDLTTGKYTSIINIAKLIKKILKERKMNIITIPSNNKDIIQQNKKNRPDKDFLKYWKPRFTLESGIRKIINFYIK